MVLGLTDVITSSCGQATILLLAPSPRLLDLEFTVVWYGNGVTCLFYSDITIYNSIFVFRFIARKPGSMADTEG